MNLSVPIYLALTVLVGVATLTLLGQTAAVSALVAIITSIAAFLLAFWAIVKIVSL